MPGAFVAEGLHEPDHPDTEIDHYQTNGTIAVAEPHEDADLWGISIAIEYRDANGMLSRRRITLRRVFHASDGQSCVGCFCHERGAVRTFRFDRIVSVIDADGVVWQPREFFTKELHVVPSLLEPSALQLAATALARASKEFAEKHHAIARAAPAARAPTSAEASEPPGYAQRRLARPGRPQPRG
jgi:hypothetical protein